MNEYGKINIKLDALIKERGISKNKLSQRAEMQRQLFAAIAKPRDHRTKHGLASNKGRGNIYCKADQEDDRADHLQHRVRGGKAIG